MHGESCYKERFAATRASDPTNAFEEFRSTQKYTPAQYVVEADSAGNYPEKPSDAVRLVCISDTHSQHEDLSELPKGDILIHAGDFSQQGKEQELIEFAAWLCDENNSFKHKIVIAGNHDLSLDVERCKAHGQSTHLKSTFMNALKQRDNVVYLEDNGIELMGLFFWGSPWQPEFFDWAFNLGRGLPCKTIWQKIPDETDVLITHGPPLGRGDLCYDQKRAGCQDLLEEIQSRIKPLAHIFGHIHEDHGASSDGVTDFINPSSCTLSYEPSQAPIVLDLYPRKSPSSSS